MRERDPRNGIVELLTGSVFAKIPFLPQIFAHPGWLASFLFDGGVPKLENVIVPGEGAMPLTDAAAP
jgi:L-lactate dehydrogenase (cytochrome)